jgi:hypothetical protein
MAEPTAIDKIRGITPEVAAKFKEHHFVNTEQLLKAGCTPEARNGLARLVGIGSKELLELLNRADLDRVGGIGAAYANLLEEVGVDTVLELSRRVPVNLHVKLLEINSVKKITTHPPTLHEIEGWVTEAKRLPILLEY